MSLEPLRTSWGYTSTATRRPRCCACISVSTSWPCWSG